jgi:hypothetical protein
MAETNWFESKDTCSRVIGILRRSFGRYEDPIRGIREMSDADIWNMHMVGKKLFLVIREVRDSWSDLQIIELMSDRRYLDNRRHETWPMPKHPTTVIPPACCHIVDRSLVGG